MRRAVGFAFGSSVLALAGYYSFVKEKLIYDEMVDVENWSGNHTVTTSRYYTPKTESEVISILKYHQRTKTPIRPTGTGLSPNGISFNDTAMINLREMNKILEIDQEKQQVRVQSGITVEDLTKQLREKGLTLQNFASIREQQLGGFTQVGAHGTGLTIPPVDEQVLGFTLITPFFGKAQITRENHPQWFSLINVGLGCFGILTEMCIQCVRDHLLREETVVSSWKEIKTNHVANLLDYKHTRYLWIPFTKEAVVIRSNPVKEKEKISEKLSKPFNAMKELLQQYDKTLTKEEIDGCSLPQLRDSLLAINCSDLSWISTINKAELSSWKSDYHGSIQCDSSDQILGFDCGGQQLVFEVAFPIGDVKSVEYDHKDIQFVEELMDLIERHNIPAPSPIEQRWTARSSSYMSPAYSDDPNCAFCWVGVIIYIPSEIQREEATTLFNSYRDLIMNELGDKYALKVHWAKIQQPKTKEQETAMRNYLLLFPHMSEYLRVMGDGDPNAILRPVLLSYFGNNR